MSTNSRPPDQLRGGREIAVGSAWMIAMRWAIRGIGLVSTILLARLLSPEDFGVIAMAMVAVALLEVFTQSGVDLALLRAKEPTKADYDAAWTLEVIQGALLAAALFFVAPLAAATFSEPRLTEIIRILSLRALIGGFQNIGVVQFRRDLAFNREFNFGVVKKLATFAVTVVAALTLRNYWALVIGQVVGRLLEVGISYAIVAFRPSFHVNGIGEIWKFSRWLILSRFAKLVHQQFDRWVVGRVGGASAMGTYYIATDLAASPAEEIVLPMSRAAFPVYSRLRDSPAQLRDSFLRVLGGMASISIAIGVGLGLVANDFVMVLLGDKWLTAAPLMPFLGIFGAVYGIVHTIDVFLLATNRERLSALLTVAYALIACVALIASAAGGITAIAYVKSLLGAVFLGGSIAALGRCAPVTSVDALRTIWPPIASAAIMAAFVLVIRTQWAITTPVFGLLRDISVGGATYLVALYALWAARGKPSGIELDVSNAFSLTIGRKKK